ncbi:hypothetical protein HQQ80_04405 [Microbacteriaceae bacterium VKM Ac-2855]|nr:hypothetical protein [Microbacteriaceae bacterium VKM Ac-2855]
MSVPRELAAWLRARPDGLSLGDDRVCELEVAGLPGQTIDVAELYGAEAAAAATREYAGELDLLDEVHVIGEDGTGNLFILDDPDVFYWDRARLHAFDDDRIPTLDSAGGELYALGDFEEFVFRVIGAIRRA